MIMDSRYITNPKDAKFYTTERLRNEFLISDLFIQGAIKAVYSHNDRFIVGGICPEGKEPISLDLGKDLSADYFLAGRELGVFNIGSEGVVEADGVKFFLGNREALYVGKGTKEILFNNSDGKNPACFYFNSVPAHASYKTIQVTRDMAKKVCLGSPEESNTRSICQFIHPEVVQSCQLLMGMTILEPKNLWNTMPCHTHSRRMEVYLYFDLADDALIFHFIGEPDQTRHLVVRNKQAVISPSWSIHSGVGTRSYTFIWGMAGENQTFTDMDQIQMSDLK